MLSLRTKLWSQPLSSVFWCRIIIAPFSYHFTYICCVHVCKLECNFDTYRPRQGIDLLRWQKKFYSKSSLLVTLLLARPRSCTATSMIPFGEITKWPLVVSSCDYFIIIISPLTERVVGAPQMILQPAFSISSCSPLPSGTCRTPGLSIPWCCLPTSSSVCLGFFPLSLFLARWFWPDLMNGRRDHTTAVCASLRSSGLRVVQLPADSWHRLTRW